MLKVTLSIINMKKLILSLISIILLIISIFSCSNREREMEELGASYILKIEAYKELYGVYPNSLADINIEYKEEGPLHYEKKNDTLFIIWFGQELGDSKIYYSNTKKWDNY